MERPDFTRTLIRAGYARGPVDDVVERILRGDPDLSAAHVASLAFPTQMYHHGYDMGEVDAWLDEVQVALGGTPSPAPWNQAAPVVEAGHDDAGHAGLSQAASDRLQAALIIVVVVAAAVWLYVSRF